MTVTPMPNIDNGNTDARWLAHQWANRGIPVFPAEITWDQTKYQGAGGTDKRPLTPHGHKDATTDHHRIDELFDNAQPRPGGIIGCALLPGPAGYVVLDCDRKGGKNGIVTAERLGLPETWRATTPSGGEHRIYRLPPNTHVTNHSPWADDGIDIRANDGWIIAPGIHTPWGAWQKADAEYQWPDDIAPLPDTILDRLRTRTPNTSGTVGWTRLTPQQRNDLHPATFTALQRLEELGGHNSIHKTQPGREPWVEITRPHKRHGTSATIGYLAPGVVNCFTPNWPGLLAGVHELDDDNQLHQPATHTMDDWPEDPTEPDPDNLAPLADYRIDWHQLWTAPITDEWLIEPIIAAHRAHALYAPAKTGKSLLITWLAVMAATGRPTLERHGGEPITVLYCDLEMTPDDLRDRLEAMHIGPDDNLEHLHWLSLPPLILDTAEGARTLTTHAKHIGAQLVVIDTTARAVTGDENSADTYRAFARWTGIGLKREGIAYIRTDHAGKDLDRGQRGSSAKNDDVDIVWQLAPRDNNSITLKATHRRMGWVPDTITLQRTDDPLTYQQPDTTRFAWPPGTADLAQQLDQQNIPLHLSGRAAVNAARTAGIRGKTDTIRKAQKYRQQTLNGWDTTCG